MTKGIGKKYNGIWQKAKVIGYGVELKRYKILMNLKPNTQHLTPNDLYLRIFPHISLNDHLYIFVICIRLYAVIHQLDII